MGSRVSWVAAPRSTRRCACASSPCCTCCDRLQGVEGLCDTAEVVACSPCLGLLLRNAGAMALSAALATGWRSYLSCNFVLQSKAWPLLDVWLAA